MIISEVMLNSIRMRVIQLAAANEDMITCYGIFFHGFNHKKSTMYKQCARAIKNYKLKNKNPCFSNKTRIFGGRSGEIRTRGLLNPIQARYQTALHPE